MQTLTANLEARKNLLYTQSAWMILLDIALTSSSKIYLTNNVRDVTFNGQTYTSRAMRIDPITADSGGQTPAWKLTLDNADQVPVAYIENNQILGETIMIRVVNEDYLTVAADFRGFRADIISAGANEEALTLTCGLYDLSKVKFPRRKFFRDACGFVFKGLDCTYAGGETSCDKRFATCENTMSNHDRCGCFPAMPYVHR